MKWDFQTLACGILLLLAVIYIFRSVRKSFKTEHDCPDCGVAIDPKKVKKHSSVLKK